MSGLSIVLTLKIVITVFAWCLPLLFAPTTFLKRLGFPDSTPHIFTRLLGAAYAALTTAYVFGLGASLGGSYPDETVWVGIVSNGGAATVLAIGAARGTWHEWGGVARACMYGSLVATTAITLGLIVFGPCRNLL